MKFLFECVSCYGTAQSDLPLEGSSRSLAARVEETRYLVSPSTMASSTATENAISAAPSSLRRRCRSVSRLGPGDWKPSLHAISEDIVIAPVKAKVKAAEQMTRVASARRSGRRCAASTPPVHSRGRGDSYGRDPVPMMVPAFSPTPFMF